MSNEVDLKLVADAKPYVDATRQAMGANQSLYNQTKQNAEFEKRNIAEINAAIYQYTQAKKQATNPKDQEKYNQKIAEAKIHLNEAKENAKKYGEEQKKLGKELEQSEKKQGIFSSGLGKLVGIVGGAIGAWNIFKNVMAATQATGDGLNVVLAGTKGAINSLMESVAAFEFSGMFEKMAAAARGAMEHEKVMDEIGDRMNSIEIQRAKLRNEIMQASMDMREALNNRDYEGFKKYKEQYETLNNEILQAEQEIATMRLESWKKNAIAVKMIRDQNTGNLRELTAEETQLMSDYVENYNKLTKNELQILANLATEREKIEGKEAQKERINNMIQNRKLYGLTAADVKELNTQYQSMTQQINESKQAHQTNINSLDGLAKKYYELDDVINRFSDTDRAVLKEMIINRYNAESAFTESNKAIQRMDLMMQKQMEADQKSANDKAKQEAEKLAAEILKITDEFNAKRIEKLTGLERIRAEEQANLNSIAKTKEYLSSLGQLTDEHLRVLQMLEDRARAEASTKENEYYQQGQQKMEANNLARLARKKKHNEDVKALDKELADWQEALDRANIKFTAKNPELEMLIYERNKKLEHINSLKAMQEDYTKMTEEEVVKRNQARAMEIAAGELEVQDMDKQIQKKELNLAAYSQAFQTAFNTITGMLQSTYNAQLQFFQRERQMMDTRIGELQRTIDQEIEARDKGYANSVEGKKRELEGLQAEREKAFEKEQKVAEAQRKLNEVIQVSQLITSAANIFATFSLVPGGTAISIALIALMLGAYVKAKVDARKLAALEKGGSGTKTGMITGKRHSEGGESFTDHVEVESGENWGVLSRPASQKYGKQFHNIVESMNKGKFDLRPVMKIPAPSVTVKNEGTRIESLEKAMRDVETAIKTQPQIFYSNGKRIEKRGRNIRIINNA